MFFNKDAFTVLIQYMSPKDVLSLRATCRRFNELATTSQIYWYYQCMSLRGRRSGWWNVSPQQREISGERKVHIKPFTLYCLRRQSWNIHNLFKELVSINPEIEREVEDKYIAGADIWRQNFLVQFHRVPNDTELEKIYKRKLKHTACAEHLKLVSNLKSNQCSIHGHMAVVYNSETEVGLLTEDITLNKRGLFMYQYLFECFHLMKKDIKKVQLDSFNVVTVSNRILSLEQEVNSLKRQRDISVNLEEWKKSVKACPFQRRVSDTYQESREKQIQKAQRENRKKLKIINN